MEKHRVDTIVPIYNLSIADFQTGEPAENEARHYFECIAATLLPNRNFYMFSEKCLDMLADGYKNDNLTLTVMHEKYQTVGLGACSDATVMDGNLYVQAYIKKGLTFPQGALGNSEQFIDAIMDGFLSDVSVSVMMRKAVCSICGADAIYWWRSECEHIRGKEYVTGEGKQKKIATCYTVIEEGYPIELSLVQEGADPNATIIEKVVNLAADGTADATAIVNLQQEYPQYASVFADILKTPPEPLPTTDKGQQGQLDTPPTIGVNMAAADKTTSQPDIENYKRREAELENKFQSLENEKRTVELQVQTLELRVDEAKQQQATADARIKELETEALENAERIKDGEFARKEIEAEFVKQYVRSEGTDCTPEMQAQRAEFAKTQSLEKLKGYTEVYKDFADKRFAPGRKTREPNQDGTDNPDGTEPTPSATPRTHRAFGVA